MKTSANGQGKTDSQMCISAKALGVLIHIITEDCHISAESLANELKEGISSIRNALKELRKLGFLETLTSRTSTGQFSKSSKITPLGYAFISEKLGRIGTYNDHFIEFFYNHPSQSGISLEKLVPRQESHHFRILTNQGFCGFSSEENTEIVKYQEEEARRIVERDYEIQRQAWVDSQRKTRKKRFETRIGREQESWTCTDVSFEFGDRVEKYWNIEPWKVTQTRFTQILKTMRLKHGTNGRIECQIIEYFFETEAVDEFRDGNSLQSKFFYRFPEILGRLRILGALDSPEEKEARELSIRLEAKASWAKWEQDLAEPSIPKEVLENRRLYSEKKTRLEIWLNDRTNSEEENLKLAAQLEALEFEFTPR